MKKIGFIFQKLVIASLAIGAMVTVIPFVLGMIDFSVNGVDSIFAAMYDYLFLSYTNL